jgi:hypothetical protein
MAGPGIVITIKLDPFHQEFLKGYFKQTFRGAFFWPKGHLITKKFITLLRKPPDNFTSPKFGDWAFSVDVPWMFDKDPYYCHYLSDQGNKMLQKSIREFADMVFHEEMLKLRNNGHEYKDCILLFMEDYQISEKHFDRLLKDYQRFRNRISVQKFRKNQKNRFISARKMSTT